MCPVLRWVGLGLVGIAILIGLHHLYIAGVLFEMEDVLHHEWFMALSGALGLGILIGLRAHRAPDR